MEEGRTDPVEYLQERLPQCASENKPDDNVFIREVAVLKLCLTNDLQYIFDSVSSTPLSLDTSELNVTINNGGERLDADMGTCLEAEYSGTRVDN